MRQVGAALGLLALVFSAVFAGDFFSLRTRLLGSDTPPPRAPAVSRVAEEPDTPVTPEVTLVRSYPWWQELATFEGEGDDSVSVTIDDAALQWRVTWTCERGAIVVEATEHPEPLVDAACGDGGEAYSTQTGPMTLAVGGDGPWQLAVEQQVDVPLEEQPLPAMTAPSTTVLASGSFYDVDQVGRGTVHVYRFEDGTAAMRLEDFFATPNVDLEVRLSPLAAPQTTEEYLSAPSELVARLDVTAGSMNFLVPATIDLAQFQSVVIWCPPIQSAYAAATLTPPPA